MIGQDIPPPRPPAGSFSAVILRRSAMDAAPALLAYAAPDDSASASLFMFSPACVAPGRGGPNDPQSEDGGWAAFDVDNNWAVLNQVPFADHNAMLDPTCPDITGRVLECLCRRGMAGHEAVRRHR